MDKLSKSIEKVQSGKRKFKAVAKKVVCSTESGIGRYQKGTQLPFLQEWQAKRLNNVGYGFLRELKKRKLKKVGALIIL